MAAPPPSALLPGRGRAGAAGPRSGPSSGHSSRPLLPVPAPATPPGPSSATPPVPSPGPYSSRSLLPAPAPAAPPGPFSRSLLRPPQRPLHRQCSKHGLHAEPLPTRAVAPLAPCAAARPSALSAVLSPQSPG
uniref:sterile alpha motif domain-containing protein 1-like n=1 Tax=Agelaius phoeniceus TaxID=39638 RepID=UPI0023ECCAD9|nr:sterile alpha motif domain-containing protein 1-like [Agelaius phoeniceus]